MCSAFNSSKCTHSCSSGHLGSSWGFGALLKGLTSVVDNSCRSRDSNPQPRVTSPTLYPLGHDCPTNCGALAVLCFIFMDSFEMDFKLWKLTYLFKIGLHFFPTQNIFYFSFSLFFIYSFLVNFCIYLFVDFGVKFNLDIFLRFFHSLAYFGDKIKCIIWCIRCIMVTNMHSSYFSLRTWLIKYN